MKSIVILGVLMAMMPITLSAQIKSGDGSSKAPIVISDSAQDDAVHKDGQSASDGVPRDPKELLQEYEAEFRTRDIPLNWEVFVTPSIAVVISDLSSGVKQPHNAWQRMG